MPDVDQVLTLISYIKKGIKSNLTQINVYPNFPHLSMKHFKLSYVKLWRTYINNVYVHVYVYVSMHIPLHMHMYMYMFMYVYMYIVNCTYNQTYTYHACLASWKYEKLVRPIFIVNFSGWGRSPLKYSNRLLWKDRWCHLQVLEYNVYGMICKYDVCRKKMLFVAEQCIT